MRPVVFVFNMGLIVSHVSPIHISPAVITLAEVDTANFGLFIIILKSLISECRNIVTSNSVRICRAPKN